MVKEVNDIKPIKQAIADTWFIDCWPGKYLDGAANGIGIDILDDTLIDYIDADIGCPQRHNTVYFIQRKHNLLCRVRDYLSKAGVAFDEFNGLPPTRINRVKSYEFMTLVVWNILIAAIVLYDVIGKRLSSSFYKTYGSSISAVFKKYPKITGILISELDLYHPGTEFYDYAMKDEDSIDFDADHTDEAVNDSNADKFKDWIIKFSSSASEKDKMRVRNWFNAKKSHKQIFAEINKVAGNPSKFNCRLALFVEMLCNDDGLDYFFEKTGFANREDLFMAYFEKLTMFDYETKRSFIKKYLVK